MKSFTRALLAALLLLAPSWATAQVGEPPLKVLFIGNSYTSVNDLPSLIMGLADAAGGRTIETGQHLVGGCTLERHVKDKKAIDKIREKNWDVVVLQDQSLGPILNRESMDTHARILDAEIKKQGARTVFYLTWARQHIPGMQTGADPASAPDYAKAMYQMSGAAKTTDFEKWCEQHKSGLVGGLDGAYFDIAKELKATVAPVGVAWKKALAADPSLVLHMQDKSHPNANGSYLAACVFYATLFDKSPLGLPGELKKGNRVLVQLVPGEAKVLQEIAWQTVQGARMAALEINRDLAYTEPKNERQTLDVYAPTEGKGRPVVFWIHGGGWQRGDKAEVQAKPQAFVSRGFVFVSTNYRFVPEVTIKEMAGDIAKSIRWVHVHATEYGGDSGTIFVMGHSAGAQLAALVCTDDRYLKAEGLPLSIIRGCVPVDGDTYDVPMQIRTVEQRRADIYRWKFGNEDSQKDLSPVSHVAKGKPIPPFLILHVADHPETKAQSQRLAKALQEAAILARAVPAEAKNHTERRVSWPGRTPTKENLLPRRRCWRRN